MEYSARAITTLFIKVFDINLILYLVDWEIRLHAWLVTLIRFIMLAPGPHANHLSLVARVATNYCHTSSQNITLATICLNDYNAYYRPVCVQTETWITSLGYKVHTREYARYFLRLLKRYFYTHNATTQCRFTATAVGYDDGVVNTLMPSDICMRQ